MKKIIGMLLSMILILSSCSNFEEIKKLENNKNDVSKN